MKGFARFRFVAHGAVPIRLPRLGRDDQLPPTSFGAASFGTRGTHVAERTETPPE